MDISPVIPSPDQPVPDDFDPLCEHCGYSLTGLTTQNRCPECGELFDPIALPLARVPWLYRRRIGNRLAFRKTVWMVIRHPVFFARELSRPVRISAVDAQKFRRAVVRRAVLSVTAIGWCAMLAANHRELFKLDLIQWAFVFVATMTGMLGLYMFFMLCTDLPTFIWSGLKTQPYELAPLHHYASAPLALWPLIAFVCIGALGVAALLDPSRNIVQAMAVLIVVLAGMFLFLTWWLPQVLMQNGSSCSRKRVAVLALYLPIHWAMMLFVIGVPTIFLVMIYMRIGGIIIS